MDECAPQPCGNQADCTDNLLPATGYVCTCKEYVGWTGVGGLDGTTCTGLRAYLCNSTFGFLYLAIFPDRIDCNSTVCGIKADCVDLSPPLNGWNCVCGTGYVGADSIDGETCIGTDPCGLLLLSSFSCSTRRHRCLYYCFLPPQQRLCGLASTLAVLHVQLLCWLCGGWLGQLHW